MDVPLSLRRWDETVARHRAHGVHVTSSASNDDAPAADDGEAEEEETTTNEYAVAPLACVLALFDGKLSVLRHALQQANAQVRRLQRQRPGPSG